MKKFKQWFAIIILSVLILSGCGTPQPVVLTPEPIARSKPVEAMQGCGVLPTLPPALSAMSSRDALAAILRNKFSADNLFRECALRHQSLVDWINAEPTPDP